MRQQGIWARRARNAIAVALVSLGVIAVSAGTAAADKKCTVTPQHAICFEITKVASDSYRVHVGIDINIGPLDAEAILAQPGNPLDAWAMGDDSADNAEFNIPQTWIAVGAHGLSAEFERFVPRSALNEDPFPGDGDELYGRVRLFDNRTPHVRVFTSKTINV